MSLDARDLHLVRLGRSGSAGDPSLSPPPTPSVMREADEAFARLFDRHAPVVRALCLSTLRNDADADDALQETFIRAHRMLDRLDHDDGFRTWLYAIARLVCAERRRSAARRTRHERAAADRVASASLDRSVSASPGVREGGGAHVNHTATGDPLSVPLSPAGSIDQREQLERLSEAMEQLPDDERLAVHLYYLDADPVTAAGECLGVSRSGFYKLLTRARERLAELMTRSPA